MNPLTRMLLQPDQHQYSDGVDPGLRLLADFANKVKSDYSRHWSGPESLYIKTFRGAVSYSKVLQTNQARRDVVIPGDIPHPDDYPAFVIEICKAIIDLNNVID